MICVSTGLTILLSEVVMDIGISEVTGVGIPSLFALSTATYPFVGPLVANDVGVVLIKRFVAMLEFLNTIRSNSDEEKPGAAIAIFASPAFIAFIFIFDIIWPSSCVTPST